MTPKHLNLLILDNQKVSNELSVAEFEQLKNAFQKKSQSRQDFEQNDGEIRLNDEFFMKLPKNRWFSIQAGGSIYTPRTGHTVSVKGNNVYLFAGIDSDSMKNDMYKYNIFENNWQRIKSSGMVPSARSGMESVTLENIGKIYYFGGYVSKDSHHCNDIFCFDTITETWQQVKESPDCPPDQIPRKRTDHAFFYYDGALYVYGGRGENKEILGDMKKFNIQRKFWSKIDGEGACVKPRFGHTCVCVENSLFMQGGWDGLNCLDDFYEYSFITNIWYDLRRTAGKKPTPRYRHESTSCKGKMYVFGGVDQKRNRYNDLYEYDIVKRYWTELNITGCVPSPRSFHKLAIYKNLLMVLGGISDSDRKNDLYFLSLNEDFNSSNIALRSSVSSSEWLDSMASLSARGESEDEIIVNILNDQVKEISKKLQKEEEKYLCKICFAREIDSVLMDCCHFVLCVACSQTINQCPICRAKITRVIKTYNY